MLNFAAEDAANAIHSIRVPFEQYTQAQQITRELYWRTEHYGKAFGITVTGQTGSGKSSTIDKLKQEFPPIYEEEKTVHPMVFISVSANPDTKFIYRAILDQLGVKPPKRATERELREQTITLLLEAESKLLVADEVQHFVEKGTQKNHAKIADCFKGLMDEGKVSVAFFGLPYLQNLLDANSQLRRRFAETYELRGWDINSDEEAVELCRVIKSLVMNSGCKASLEEFDNDEVIESIYYATDGRIANLVTLLAEAVRLVTIDKGKVISQEYLEKAFRAKIWSSVPDERNPFNKNFERAKLNHVGECFAEELVFGWN